MGRSAPSPDLVAAVSRIKADGARMSADAVLAQLQLLAEWADVTLTQVRRDITLAKEVVVDRRMQGQLRDRSERDRNQRHKKNPVPGSAGIEVGGRTFIDRMPQPRPLWDASGVPQGASLRLLLEEAPLCGDFSRL